jgi:hypothetical protein
MSFRLLLLQGLIISGAVAQLSASDSLYDARTARKLKDYPTVELAPKSSMMRASVDVIRVDLGPRSSRFCYDERMVRAAQIAEARARSRSARLCWRYVKAALYRANLLNYLPTTAYAKHAGDELAYKFGFKRIAVSDPYKAPIGSVLVYGGKGPGHVEIRTATGFVSDFASRTPSKRPLIGVYVKPA